MSLNNLTKILLLMMLRRMRKGKEKARKRRTIWVRDISPKREMHNEYYYLLPDLLSGDREFYFRYLRMNPERFEHLLSLVKGTLNAFDDFKNNKKFVWSNVFWYPKACIFWKCIQYTIHWDKMQMLKKISFGQNKRYKKCPLFPSRTTTHHIFTFNFYSFMRWSTRFVSLKLCVRFSIFVLYFCSTKCMDFLT